MIKIKRSDPPEWLTAQDGSWHKETEKAITHYESGETSAFDFKMYSDTRLKNELKTIFTKCAYCESTYGAVFDGDVEHFRPKGRVSEKNPKNPGYYWLANDWHNLLLACQHCNQRRQHILYGEENLAGYGKLDQFPLKDESKRASRGPLDAEEKVRLLINPCVDQPEKHFQYEKEAGVVRSTTPMGKTSIKVYALQRPLLVLERKKQLI